MKYKPGMLVSIAGSCKESIGCPAWWVNMTEGINQIQEVINEIEKLKQEESSLYRRYMEAKAEIAKRLTVIQGKCKHPETTTSSAQYERLTSTCTICGAELQ